MCGRFFAVKMCINCCFFYNKESKNNFSLKQSVKATLLASRNNNSENQKGAITLAAHRHNVIMSKLFMDCPQPPMTSFFYDISLLTCVHRRLKTP